MVDHGTLFVRCMKEFDDGRGVGSVADYLESDVRAG